VKHEKLPRNIKSLTFLYRKTWHKITSHYQQNLKEFLIDRLGRKHQTYTKKIQRELRELASWIFIAHFKTDELHVRVETCRVETCTKVVNKHTIFRSMFTAVQGLYFVTCVSIAKFDFAISNFSRGRVSGSITRIQVFVLVLDADASLGGCVNEQQ